MNSQSIRYDQQNNILYCQGDWRVGKLTDVENQINSVLKNILSPLSIDGSKLSFLDSGGAWLIHRTINHLKQSNITTTLNNFSQQHLNLFTLLNDRTKALTLVEEPVAQYNFFSIIGNETVKRISGALEFLSFVGEVSLIIRGFFVRLRHFQINAVLRIIEDAGYHALPIIGLLSFLVGVVLAYQLGRQLETYGANIYIVDLSGMAILREFGPLITAIIVAGRTGSSFTAQIGLMKVNEEIDALKTLGLSPINRIVVPRLLGTILSVPLLTIWSNIFAVFGSMIMARNMLGITPTDFLTRFANNIDRTTLWTGLGKTPVFAIAIALVGCFQGFRVRYTAESIGTHTTMSVVQAIFLIIVIDAIFSILYSWAGL